MRREEALRKADRIARTVREGKVPYGVLQVVLYGSVARGDDSRGDVDLYIQLDRSSVPVEELYAEARGARGVGYKLRAALKAQPQEHVTLQWGLEPWEEHRLRFTKPEEVEGSLERRVAGLDLTLVSHRKAKQQWERSAKKRKVKPFEWPPKGVVLYEAPSQAINSQ